MFYIEYVVSFNDRLLSFSPRELEILATSTVCSLQGIIWSFENILCVLNENRILRLFITTREQVLHSGQLEPIFVVTV